MEVHAIRTGKLVGNETFLRAEGWGSLLRRRKSYEFPIHAFVVEHAEGLVLIDTGARADTRVPWAQRRFVPAPAVRPQDEIAPRMRAHGLDPQAVRTVVLTHLDWDHAGGVGAFPRAQVLVHRPEHQFASTRMGRMRYQTRAWPRSFRPTLYDLEPQPLGPFPESRAVTADGAIRLVPLAGHSAGQVGVVVESGGRTLLFAADHTLRADWFEEDHAAGRLLGLGLFFPEQARVTSERVHAFLQDRRAVLVPSHDADAEVRLRRPAAVAA